MPPLYKGLLVSVAWGHRWRAYDRGPHTMRTKPPTCMNGSHRISHTVVTHSTLGKHLGWTATVKYQSFYLSNLWCASSQSGYRVCPIIRSHEPKKFFDLFWPKTPRKVEITTFDFLRGTPIPRWPPLYDNLHISVI